MVTWKRRHCTTDLVPFQSLLNVLPHKKGLSLGQAGTLQYPLSPRPHGPRYTKSFERVFGLLVPSSLQRFYSSASQSFSTLFKASQSLLQFSLSASTIPLSSSTKPPAITSPDHARPHPVLRCPPRVYQRYRPLYQFTTSARLQRSRLSRRVCAHPSWRGDHARPRCRLIVPLCVEMYK